MALLVLIVDDDERNAKLARDVLLAAGLSTLTATTPAPTSVRARNRVHAFIFSAPFGIRPSTSHDRGMELKGCPGGQHPELGRPTRSSTAQLRQ